MQRRLTRKLKWLMFSTLLATGFQVQAVEPGALPQQALDGQEQARYLGQIKKLYLTGNDRQALLEHCNALLRSYALRADYQVGQPKRQDLLYQVSAGASGELLVRKEIRSQGNIEVTHERLSVFGVDPYIRYSCNAGAIACEIKSPADGSPWLTIVRDHQGAEELAKALSFLIRNLQKG
jgi:hypothetical protein